MAFCMRAKLPSRQGDLIETEVVLASNKSLKRREAAIWPVGSNGHV